MFTPNGLRFSGHVARDADIRNTQKNVCHRSMARPRVAAGEDGFQI